MNREKLKYFENRLLKEKEKIISQLSYEKDQFGDLHKKEIGDLVDQAFNMYEKDRAIQFTESEKQALIAINAALQLVKLKTYGMCSCGKNIEENRLEAIPWARLCMACAKKKRV